MDFWQAVVMGIVEGFTEFLPISSTAHLILAGYLLGVLQTDFVKSFEIAIQLGAISAVAWLYWDKLLFDKEVTKRVVVAFLPTSVIGFLLYKIFKGLLLENLALIASMLFLGGVFLVVFEYWHREEDEAVGDIREMSYRQCLLIGLFQSIAIVPGVSRSGATIIGGLLLGLKRVTIVEFSFLLAVPTMLAATGYDLLKSGAGFSGNQFGVLVLGLLASFLSAILAVKFLLRYIQTNSFTGFGVYRVIMATAIIFFVL